MAGSRGAWQRGSIQSVWDWRRLEPPSLPPSFPRDPRGKIVARRSSRSCENTAEYNLEMKIRRRGRERAPREGCREAGLERRGETLQSREGRVGSGGLTCLPWESGGVERPRLRAVACRSRSRRLDSRVRSQAREIRTSAFGSPLRSFRPAGHRAAPRSPAAMPS